MPRREGDGRPFEYGVTNFDEFDKTRWLFPLASGLGEHKDMPPIAVGDTSSDGNGIGQPPIHEQAAVMGDWPLDQGLLNRHFVMDWGLEGPYPGNEQRPHGNYHQIQWNAQFKVV